MNLDYFYKIGHCRELSIAEFETLTNSEGQYEKDFIFSAKRFPVFKGGSIVFGGVVLYTIKDYNKSKEQELKEVISDSIQIGLMNGKFKKMGFAAPSHLTKNLINWAKEAGSKKVNILKDQFPNFGHWKSTNDWIIVIPVGKDLIIGETTHYTDQQFWSKIDTRLPHGDMKRGIINLKLARTMLNLSSKPIIWDPFCGQGRIIASGLDIKREFYASDIDEVCVKDVKENYEYASYQVAKRSKKVAELKDIFQMDAKELSDNYITERLNRTYELSDLGIVTEGYLGFNFEQQPTEKEAANQLVQIEKLWDKVLSEAKQANTQEIVFCLPFYKFKRKNIIPQFIEKVVTKNGYQVTKFNNNPYILYSREKTRVGHCIVKITLS